MEVPLQPVCTTTAEVAPCCSALEHKQNLMCGLCLQGAAPHLWCQDVLVGQAAPVGLINAPDLGSRSCIHFSLKGCSDIQKRSCVLLDVCFWICAAWTKFRLFK